MLTHQNEVYIKNRIEYLVDRNATCGNDVDKMVEELLKLVNSIGGEVKKRNDWV